MSIAPNGCRRPTPRWRSSKRLTPRCSARWPGRKSTSTTATRGTLQKTLPSMRPTPPCNSGPCATAWWSWPERKPCAARPCDCCRSFARPGARSSLPERPQPTSMPSPRRNRRNSPRRDRLHRWMARPWPPRSAHTVRPRKSSCSGKRRTGCSAKCARMATPAPRWCSIRPARETMTM